MGEVGGPGDAHAHAMWGGRDTVIQCVGHMLLLQFTGAVSSKLSFNQQLSFAILLVTDVMNASSMVSQCGEASISARS